MNQEPRLKVRHVTVDELMKRSRLKMKEFKMF